MTGIPGYPFLWATTRDALDSSLLATSTYCEIQTGSLTPLNHSREKVCELVFTLSCKKNPRLSVAAGDTKILSYPHILTTSDTSI